MQYAPTTSFPQLNNPSQLIGPSLSSTNIIPSSLAPHMDTTGIMSLSLLNSSASNTQQQRLLLPPPSSLSPTVSSSILPPYHNQGPQPPLFNPLLVHHSKSAQVVDRTTSIRERLTPLIQSETLPIQRISELFTTPPSTSLNPSAVNFEGRADLSVTPPEGRNFFANELANNLNTAFTGAPPRLQHTVNPLQQSGVVPLHKFPDNLDLNNPATHSESSFIESTMDLMFLDLDDGQWDNDDLDEGPDHRNPQGVLLSYMEICDFMYILGESSETSSNEDLDAENDCEASERPIQKKSFSRNTRSRSFAPLSSGDLHLKETQSSGARNPNFSSNKRLRSSSPSSRGLGSRQNPIDVDKVGSLFEPIVIREYVWAFIPRFTYAENTLQVKEEEISLPLRANPPIKGNKSYTFFDVTGEPKLFTPSFHVSRKKFNVIPLLIFFVSSTFIMNDSVNFLIVLKRFMMMVNPFTSHDQGIPLSSHSLTKHGRH